MRWIAFVILPTIVWLGLAVDLRAEDKDGDTPVFYSLGKYKPGKYTGEKAQEIGRAIFNTMHTTIHPRREDLPLASDGIWVYGGGAAEDDLKSIGYTLRIDNEASSNSKDRLKIEVVAVRLKDGLNGWSESIDRNTYDRVSPGIGVAYRGLFWTLKVSSPYMMVERAEVKSKTITLHYVLTPATEGQSFPWWVGLGVGADAEEKSWTKMLMNRLTKVTLVVDAMDLRPLEASTPDGIRETYSKYVYFSQYVDAEISAGGQRYRHRAPQQIDIVRGDTKFSLRFVAYEPGLWLLDKAEYTLKGKPVATSMVRNVKVNGEKAVEIKPGASIPGK